VSTRTYRQPDGSLTSGGPLLAGGYVGAADAAMAVAIAWYRVEREIPTATAVGFASHESGYATNIHTVEPNGHTTGGVFEIDLPSVYPYFNKGDAVAVGAPWLNWWDLNDCCAIFAARLRGYKVRIIAAANAYNAANGANPIDETALPADLYSYLGIAHNMGIGTALQSIKTYGMDWAAFKARPENAGLNIVQARSGGTYGDDVVSGGPDFTEAMIVPFDSAGALIPPPAIDAFWWSNIRLALFVALVVAVLYFFAVNKTPLKGTL
jgi:hypothetical protein